MPYPEPSVPLLPALAGAGGYGIVLKPGYSPEFVLSLLNSRLLDWYLHQVSSPFRGGYYSYESRFIGQLPIYSPDLNTPEGCREHDRLVTLAQRMLDLHQHLAAKGGLHDTEREHVEREITITDREIDTLVYDLYGLTSKERALIEAEVRP